MNFSKEEERIILIILLFGGGLAGIFAGAALAPVRQALIDYHILVDEGIVIPVFGADLGLDWARVIIIAAIAVLALGTIVLLAVLRFRRRRRFNRIADML